MLRRPIIAHCDKWQMEDMRYIFDETHAEHKEAAETLRSFPDLRVQFQMYSKELQSILAVAKSHEEDLKPIIANIAKSRASAAQIVACAVMSQVVFKQSLYKAQGSLSAMIQAGMKQAGSMGVSMGDLPGKLRTFVEGLSKDAPDAPDGFKSKAKDSQPTPATSSTVAQKRPIEDQADAVMEQDEKKKQKNTRKTKQRRRRLMMKRSRHRQRKRSVVFVCVWDL